jgi:hypothetical protein
MSDGFRILATRCGNCGCGCPTIIEAPNDAIVIIGSSVSELAGAAAIKERTGEGEAAVVIPKSLLIEALRSLQA